VIFCARCEGHNRNNINICVDCLSENELDEQKLEQLLEELEEEE
jgi:hypothetical protein